MSSTHTGLDCVKKQLGDEYLMLGPLSTYVLIDHKRSEGNCGTRNSWIYSPLLLQKYQPLNSSQPSLHVGEFFVVQYF